MGPGICRRGVHKLEIWEMHKLEMPEGVHNVIGLSSKEVQQFEKKLKCRFIVSSPYFPPIYIFLGVYDRIHPHRPVYLFNRGDTKKSPDVLYCSAGHSRVVLCGRAI